MAYIPRYIHRINEDVGHLANFIGGPGFKINYRNFEARSLPKPDRPTFHGFVYHEPEADETETDLPVTAKRRWYHFGRRKAT